MVDIVTRSTATSLKRKPVSTTIFSTIKLSTGPWPNTWITSYGWSCTCGTECSRLIFCSYIICSSTSCSFTCSCTCFLLRLSSRFITISCSISFMLSTSYGLSCSATFSRDPWEITSRLRTIPCSLPLRRITVFISFYYDFCSWPCSPVITDMFRNRNTSIFL